MPVERERLVLGGDEDAPEPGVDAVAQREVDDPVGSAEIDGRLGPFLGQGIEPLAGAAGKQDDHDVVEFHMAVQASDGVAILACAAGLARAKTREIPSISRTLPD
jgi:hypothetical protein